MLFVIIAAVLVGGAVFYYFIESHYKFKKFQEEELTYRLTITEDNKKAMFDKEFEYNSKSFERQQEQMQKQHEADILRAQQMNQALKELKGDF